RVAIAWRLAQRLRERGARYPAGTQQHRRAAREVDDGGLEPDLARAAIDDEEVGAELVAHMRGGRGAHVAELVRRGCRDRAAAHARELAQQRLRDRVR